MPLFTSDELRANAPVQIPSIIGSGLLPECGTMLVTGKTEHAKSVLGFDMAISLALGEPLFRAFKKKHGEEGKPYFPVKQARRVLYLDSELGPFGCHERLQIIYKTRKIGVNIGDYFKIVSGIFDPLLLHETSHDSKPYNNLKKLIAETKPEVVFVDPLGDYHLYDEDNNQMRQVFRYLRNLQYEFKFASILLHHESDKPHFDSRGMPIERAGTSRSRGHSSIAQSVDSMLCVTRQKKNPYTFLELRWEKVRHQQRPPSGWVFLDLNRMHIEWFCSLREPGIPGKQQAFLREYETKNVLDPDTVFED